MADLILVGAGNIGSHVAPHLARMRGVSRVTVIDQDEYSEGNLESQNVDARDLGKPKAAVQANRMRRMNPGLAVEAIHAAVENVPLGCLRGDLILAALDSRRARMVVNQAARRLGVPWIDAGVSADDLLARVQVFSADHDAACLECAWGDADYALVEQDYPCQALTSPPPTNAPSALGALAAAFQAIECEKWLTGRSADLLLGRELLISARHHKHFVTTTRRNPTCRMPDHDPWAIERSTVPAAERTIREALALARESPDGAGHLDFGVAGQSLALAVACPNCGRSKSVFRLERSLRLKPIVCWHCRRPMMPVGFDLHDHLPARSIPPRALDQRLSRVGIEAGDVLTLSTPVGAAHHEVGGLS